MTRIFLPALFLAACAVGHADTPETRAASWLGSTLGQVSAIYGAPSHTRQGWTVYRFEQHVRRDKGGTARLHWCELRLKVENDRVADWDVEGFGTACDQFVVGRS